MAPMFLSRSLGHIPQASKMPVIPISDIRTGARGPRGQRGSCSFGVHVSPRAGLQE